MWHIKSHFWQERVEGGEASEGAQGASVGLPHPALWGPCLGHLWAGPERGLQGGWCAHPCASAVTTSGWRCSAPRWRAPPPSSAAMRSSGTPSTHQSSKIKLILAKINIMDHSSLHDIWKRVAHPLLSIFILLLIRPLEQQITCRSGHPTGLQRDNKNPSFYFPLSNPSTVTALFPRLNPSPSLS